MNMWNNTMTEIEITLHEYYRKRNSIENSFSYKYHGTVQKRVDNLTKKYSKLLEKEMDKRGVVYEDRELRDVNH